MKRILSGLVSLSLILVTPPPSAWAQFSAAVRAVPTGTPAVTGAQAGAASLGAGASVAPLSAASLTAMPLGASSFSAAPSAPMALSAAVPAAAAVSASPASSAAKSASVAAALPSAAASPVAASRLESVAAPVRAEAAVAPAAGARAVLSGAARELSAPNAEASVSLERLFTGAARRAALAEAPAVSAAPSLSSSRLAAASVREDGPSANVPEPAAAPAQLRAGKVVGAFKSFGRMALAAVAVVGVNAAAVAFLPSLFAVVPVAAVWAVSSGVLLFPAALYARYRLSLRDSPRLGKVKGLLDLAIGAYAGALVVAAPSLALTLSSAGLLTSLIPAAGFAAGLAVRGAPFLNSVMVWGALGLTPLAVGAAAVGGLAVAPIMGMLALPAMTTMAFFLGSIINSAETGRPFSVPGSLQKMRFPSFQWVMIGVVFALLTGYSAVHTNLAFLAWNFLGSRAPASWDKTKPLWKNLLNKAANFDLLFLGLLVFTAATGFTSPLTFLVLAFSGERAAVWTERLLTRFLPRAQPAPSTNAAPVTDDAAVEKPSRWPQYQYRFKTAAILAAMAGIGALMGVTVFGFHSLLVNLLPAAALAFLPFWFATKLIKVLMHDTPADEKNDPEFFSIMKSLREKINAKRRAEGKKEIPMPEMVNDPLPLPNAYATGRDPFHALVGVTAGIKEMTLDPENVREGVARLIASVAPGTKAFRVFRLAISGSISGVTESSSAADIQAAVLKADRAELKALGVRMLTGVLGHEFSHVMDRHMLSGAIAGAVASSIAFASYGVMWAVGHAQTAAKKAWDKLTGRREAPQDLSEDDGKARLAEPISTGVAIKSLPALLKLFAALWVPVLVQIVQMASSRNNEGMADEDGALLSEDPQSLALALGMLTTWRPKAGFTLPGLDLPRLTALSAMMTVNPLQQAQQAGALPKLDPVTEAVVGKSDDFLFDLFVTHPDTGVRINKLADMAEAMRAGQTKR